jgi:hypothetical protein
LAGHINLDVLIDKVDGNAALNGRARAGYGVGDAVDSVLRPWRVRQGNRNRPEGGNIVHEDAQFRRTYIGTGFARRQFGQVELQQTFRIVRAANIDYRLRAIVVRVARINVSIA